MLQQTQFKLQRLQTEYKQLSAQCTMLNNKAQEHQNYLVGLRNQIKLNPTDTSLKAQYNSVVQQIRNINQTITRNQSKLVSLQRQIAVEEARFTSQQQKAMMSAYRKQTRGSYPKY